LRFRFLCGIVIVLTTFRRQPQPYIKATAMPNPPNHDAQVTSAAVPRPVDAFFARVIRNVRRTEARVRREERLTDIPHRFSYCLREVSRLTGLSVPLLRKLIRAGEIAANKTNGWWMNRRRQLLRLLPAACRVTY